MHDAIGSVGLVAVLLMLAAFANTVLFTCMCGHVGREALAVNTAAVVIGAWIWRRRAAGGDRLLAAFAFFVSVAILIRNMMDAAWFGHDPWFGSPGEMAHTVIRNSAFGSAGALFALAAGARMARRPSSSGADEGRGR